jgi:hypothetical protein
MVVNPPRRTAVTSLAVALFGVIMFFVPGFLGVDGFDGGFAVSFLSLFVAVVAVIVAVLYFGYSGKLDRILRGQGLLAHWTYTPEYWNEYTQKEFEEEKTEKKGLFIIATGFALFFGFLFWALDSEAGFYVFLTMLGLIGLIAFVWQFSAWVNYRQNLTGVREAYIGRDAVFMNRKFYPFRSWFTSFDGVTLEKKRGLTLLVFKYTTANRTGAQTYTTRVPVPPGEEENAEKILTQMNPKQFY